MNLSSLRSTLLTGLLICPISLIFVFTMYVHDTRSLIGLASCSLGHESYLYALSLVHQALIIFHWVSCLWSTLWLDSDPLYILNLVLSVLTQSLIAHTTYKTDICLYSLILCFTRAWSSQALTFSSLQYDFAWIWISLLVLHGHWCWTATQFRIWSLTLYPDSGPY